MVAITFAKLCLTSDSSQRGVKVAHTTARKLKIQKVNIVSTASPWSNFSSHPVGVRFCKARLISAKKAASTVKTQPSIANLPWQYQAVLWSRKHR